MISIIVFGSLKDKRLNELVEEFLQRLTRFSFLKVDIIEFKDGGTHDNEQRVLQYKDGNSNTRIFLLDEHAKTYSTLEDILDAADADDWDKLVTGNFTTATTGKIRAKIFFSKYLATTNVFIDPEETEN